MNTTVELPSGKILNLARFIALIPAENTKDDSSDLILEGYPTPIRVNHEDADIIRKFLNLGNTSYPNEKPAWSMEEQLRRNVPRMVALEKYMERNKNMSDEEAQQRQEFFESFKQTVDAERPAGQKLYSES
ncbi:hypothetical protein NIES4071_17190 [Calothrix sp. NIES-4071]|nr:hypothetical protein NIES4071_17190 [Calothrix sp. NIES-4071]BAZ56052.1 hypothetical protein NIES4105_17140 [Calothrix sp. NIES-4105]